MQVQLIRGKDKGKKGVVTRVLRARNRLVVEGLNLVRPAYLRSLCLIVASIGQEACEAI